MYFSYKAPQTRNPPRIRLNTNYKLHPSQWDKRRQQAKGKGSADINAKLLEYKTLIYNWYTENQHLNHEELKQGIADILNPEITVNKGLDTAIKKFLQHKQNTISSSGYKTYKYGFNTLLEYTSNTLQWEDFMSHSFFEDYQQYLIDKGLLNNTIQFKVMFIQSFLRWAVEHNYIDTFADFKAINGFGSTKISLSESELRQFTDYQPKSKAQARAKDLFLFMCHTGQRFSDTQRVQKKDIKGDEWHMYQKKTRKETIIYFVGFLAPALDILKKYDYQLPKMSNDNIINMIKKVAKDAGLDRIIMHRSAKGGDIIEKECKLHELIGAHTARRTFITIMLSRGVPIPVVQDITQHSDVKTLMKYWKPNPDVQRAALMAAGGLIPAYNSNPQALP